VIEHRVASLLSNAIKYTWHGGLAVIEIDQSGIEANAFLSGQQRSLPPKNIPASCWESFKGFTVMKF
jgi:hypothetical protein